MKSESKEAVGVNHLNLIKGMLAKCSNLLNGGRDIYPFSKWKDALENVAEEIQEYINSDEGE